MIESPTLLSTLQRQLKVLLDDLRDQVDNDPNVGDPLRAEYQAAFDAERTGWTFTEWSEDRLTQVAVGWLLACVFVRFGEDNGLIDDAMLAGGAARGVEARAAQQDFFRTNPHASDLDYLHQVFRNAAALPGLDGVLGEGHSPLWLVDPSADACTELLALFRRTGDDGRLELEFTDPELDTRFLGDLYQDLSEHAKKTYALLQTPVFVEEFILDRTLDPAIESHGLANTDLIDPTCGSGHFLLGAFERLWQRWHDAEPGEAPAVTAQRALDAVWGVDLNPFAAAIARFRLLVAALRRCGLTRLADTPDFTIHVAVGDSLLWGAKEQHLRGMEGAGLAVDRLYLYATEDSDALRETFRRTYAAVVGNPPYIVPKDKAANAAYRERYRSCSRKFSLGVPFTELFFNLADRANVSTNAPAGQVGMITTNSFMKREMGKKLVQDYLPKWDLTHVVDTSGAFIPGHGTPTVILFGRNQPPAADAVRSVLGIRGEPSTPADPTKGLVWSSIVAQIDTPGSESDYVSVVDTDRSRFATHPWSIGGGGAAELKERLDTAGSDPLGSHVASVGFGAIAATDEVLILPAGRTLARRGVERSAIRPLGLGDQVRDWRLTGSLAAAFPYGSDRLLDLEELPGLGRWMWPYRTTMGNRATFAKRTYFEEGRPWWEWHQVALDRLHTPLSIAFSFVATHNHFVLDRSGKLFNRSAPVIKLPEGSSLEVHLGLVALLNSSVACFWLLNSMFNKGGGGAAAKLAAESWDNFFELDGTKLQLFPLPAGDRPVERGHQLDHLAAALTEWQPAAIATRGAPTRPALEAARLESERLFAEMVSAQEELDWHCLRLYGLIDEPLTVPEREQAPPLALGERAFEMVLARKVAAGETETAWFTRHRSTPTTQPPAHWPDWYRDLVNRRIELIESDRNVALIERPANKRRWNRTPWEELEQAALRDWLLDRLEDRSLWFDDDRATARTVAQLADRVSTDADWMEVARTWVGQADIDPLAVVTKLVTDEHVPAQAAARYKPSGMAKRREWEHTWDLQRAEDRGEDVGRIAVPPKYASSDFRKASYWKHRGKLDVPKERFVSVHGAERDASAGDSTMVLAWAGFDHAQLAQALATLLFQRQTADGWTGERLIPLIAALEEVVPWVEQWHPDVDPSFGQPLGTFYRGLIDQALDSIGATRATLTEWAPPAPTRGRAMAAAPSDTLLES
jgi:hypothetical protein